MVAHVNNLLGIRWFFLDTGEFIFYSQSIDTINARTVAMYRRVGMERHYMKDAGGIQAIIRILNRCGPYLREA